MQKGYISDILPFGTFSTVIVILVKTRKGLSKICFDHRPFKNLLEDFGFQAKDLIGKGIEFSNGFGDDSRIKFNPEYCLDRLNCLVDKKRCNLCS